MFTPGLRSRRALYHAFPDKRRRHSGKIIPKKKHGSVINGFLTAERDTVLRKRQWRDLFSLCWLPVCARACRRRCVGLHACSKKALVGRHREADDYEISFLRRGYPFALIVSSSIASFVRHGPGYGTFALVTPSPGRSKLLVPAVTSRLVERSLLSWLLMVCFSFCPSAGRAPSIQLERLGEGRCEARTRFDLFIL